MLDPRYILAHTEEVRENCRRRNVGEAVLKDIDAVVELETQRRNLLTEVETTRRRQNEVAAATGKARDAEQRAALVAEGKQLKADVADKEDLLKKLEADVRSKVGRIPNMTHPDAPVGTTDDANRVVRTWGTPRQFNFKPKDHVELGKALDVLDFESGAKVTGQGFYFLKNDLVLLDLALQQFGVHTLVRHGYTPIITPDLARVEILEGIGFNPRGSETQVYSVAQSDLCLIGTAEITLGGLHAGEILEEASLPLRYVGVSHCFRTEAGAPGRARRGLYRVHQFTKVEMFAFTAGTLEASSAMHLEMLAIEEEIFQALGLPYQVVDICTGDLGGPAYRKFDLEAWMPGRGTDGEYGEVTSTSDCTDYQARRLGIRYRPTGQKGTKFVHTLNGTAIALSRGILAIMENYQREDGLIDVPEVLQPYMAGRKVLGRAPEAVASR